MKKYKVYCAFGRIDESGRKHELIAVENGWDIDEATNRLRKAVRTDVLGMEKYQRGYTVAVSALDIADEYSEVNQYAYRIRATIYPDYGPKNDVIDYGVIEEDE